MNEHGQFNGAVARLEWDVCEAINSARVAAWEKKAGRQDCEDKIPGL